MSGNRNKGFSQTSKRWDGELKAQHQRSRNRQVDHSGDHRAEEEEAGPQKPVAESKRPK